jgi:hypothetical protein
VLGARPLAKELAIKRMKKIYKFRNLRNKDNDEYVYPLILKNVIWCADPSTLNDQKEFNFELKYHPTNRTLNLLSEVLAQYSNSKAVLLPPDKKALIIIENGRLADITRPIINNMIEQCRREVGVSSFSKINDDPWLWEEYGGYGEGLCIEYEIPEELVGKKYHTVDYVELNIFHVDIFLESALDKDKVFPMYKKMLLTKTKQWYKEKEIRIVGKENNILIPIDGRLSKIEFGINVSDLRFEEFYSKIRKYCILNGVEILRKKC